MKLQIKYRTLEFMTNYSIKLKCINIHTTILKTIINFT